MSTLDVNGYSSVFRSFVDFAQQSVKTGDTKAIAAAKIQKSLDGRRMITVTRSLTDAVHNWTRTNDEFSVNDITRKLFRNAIIEMFGDESKIPAEVKDAMRMEDYGQGKPLTARRILAVKNAIDVSRVDSSVGSVAKHHVRFGNGTPIRLDVIESARVPSAGFTRDTQITRGREGVAQTSREALGTLAGGSPFDAKTLLGLLKAGQTHLDRLAALDQLTKGQIAEQSWIFTHAVESLSNAELAAVYQAFTSEEMDLLRTALEIEGSSGSRDARMANGRLFDLEALVLREASRRASEMQLEDLRQTDPGDRSLWDERAPKVAEKGSKVFGNAGDDRSGRPRNDLSSPGLATLVNAAAASATQREKTASATQQDVRNRGFDVTLRQMGDVLRSKELTINMDVDTLLNKSNILQNPGQPLETYWSLKEKGVNVKGGGYGPRRDAVETQVFPELRHSPSKGRTRPVYSALNLTHASYGAADTLYGNVVIVLKPEVAKRATFTTNDSFQIVRISVTDAKKQQFYALFGSAEGIPDSLKLAVARPDSPERAALEKWLAKMAENAKSNPRSGWVCKDGDIPAELKAHFPNNPEGGQKDFQALHGLAIKCFGDADATGKVVATHDNIESLIPDLGEVNANALAEAVREKQAGGEGRVGFVDTAYIEAQIHGPVVPDRDIAEIRVNLHGPDAGNMDEGQKRQAIARLRDFEARTGIHVVIAEEGAWDAEHMELDELQGKTTRINARHYDRKKIAARQNEILANLKAESDRVIAKNQDWLNGLPEGVTFNLDGNILNRLAGKFLDKVRTRMAEDQSNSDTLSLVNHAFSDELREIVGEKVALLKEMAKLPFGSPAQMRTFARWVMEAREIRSVEEMRLVHRHAFAQAALMREILAADPPPAAGDVVGRLAQLAGEFGADDNEAGLVSLMSLELLRNGEPPVGEEGLAKLRNLFGSTEMRGYARQLDRICQEGKFGTLPGAAKVSTLKNLISFTAMNIAKLFGGEYEEPKTFDLPLELVQRPLRDAIRTVAPEVAGKLDFEYPAQPEFPRPAAPNAMPTTQAQRRQFLVGVMEEYRQKELGREKGVSTHGRGHIIRAFIYATAFANILEEQGVKVDRNALLCGIAGHDIARARPGHDYWEEASGQETVQRLGQVYGENTLGADYSQEMVDSIVGVKVTLPDGREFSIPKSQTLEAHLLQSADSLDIGRTAKFEFGQFQFLNFGGNPDKLPENIKVLREQLFREADLLQKLTNQYCANAPLMDSLAKQVLNTDGPEGMRLNEQLEDLRQISQQALITQANDGDNEAFVTNIEQVIRDNPNLFPVLSRYYHE